jgi:hypothetical protein
MYSIISSKIYIVKRKVAKFRRFSYFFSGIRRTCSAPSLEICHVSSSAARGNQGVKPRVLQHALASFFTNSGPSRISRQAEPRA